MKKQLITIALSLALCIFAQSEAKAQSNIGFIDTVKILQESEPGKVAIKRLETIQNEGIAKLESLEKTRVEAEKAEKKEDLERITNEMQAIAYTMQNQLQQEQELIFGMITQELETIVKKYREDKGLAVVFNHTDVITFDPKADITNDIMTIFNKVKMDFDKK